MMLRFWRTRSAFEMKADPRVVGDIAAFISAVVRPSSDQERTLIDRIARGDHHIAGVMLAKIIGFERRISDLAATALLLSALAGCQVASLAMAQLHLRRASELREKAAWRRRRHRGRTATLLTQESRRSLRLAIGWLAELRPSVLEIEGLWSMEFEELVEPPSSLDEMSPVSECRLADDRPSKIIVERIGDADSDSGRDINAAYQRLTDPLPLRGGGVDLDVLERTLRTEFPHFGDAVDTTMRDLYLQRWVGRHWFRLKPLLLVGPPGIGKTRFAKRVAALLGLGYAELAAGGISDDRALRGTARGWRGVQPGLALIAAAETGCANPMIIVDELDKAGGSASNGDPRATLLGLIEPETARSWFDEALLAKCDLSAVSWICTGNSVAPISIALRERLTIVHCKPPAPEDFPLLYSSVVNEIARSFDVEPSALPTIEAHSLDTLRQMFARAPDVRRLRRGLEAAFSAAARQRSRRH